MKQPPQGAKPSIQSASSGHSLNSTLLQKGENRFAVIGGAVSGSLSPLVHNAWFAHYGLNDACSNKHGYACNYTFLSIDTAQAMEGILPMLARHSNFRGFNVTNPYKAIALGMCTDSNKNCEIAASNTLKYASDESCFIAYNTDIEGFSRSLEGAISASGRVKSREGLRFCILGAGRASLAIIRAISIMKPASMVVYNRSPESEAFLSVQKNYPFITPVSDISQVDLSKADIVINTIPPQYCSGGNPQLLEGLRCDNITPQSIVMDIVYNPKLTPILSHALSRGAYIENGLSMLIYQAAISFNIWVGIAPDVEVAFKVPEVSSFDVSKLNQPHPATT